MKPAQRTRKRSVKLACCCENLGTCKSTKTGEQTTKKKSRRQTVIKWNGKGKTAMGAGNSHVHDLTDLPDLPSQEENASLKEENASLKTIMDAITDTLNNVKCPDTKNTCPVCFSSLKHGYIKGHTSALLQCTQCPTAPFLCDSCLYPCTSDSATCTNNLCPLVSTLLSCGVVSDPKSKVFGCPEFRACPKCRNLIVHESGCKFVSCRSCKHTFCFICLQDDCRKDKAKYWLLTCKKPQAQRQRFILT